MRFNVFLVGSILTAVLVALILVVIPKRNEFPGGIVLGDANAATEKVLAHSAQHLYETHCASCHGRDGAGKTSYGELANIRMPNFRSEAFHKNWTNVLVQDAIAKGPGEMPGFAHKLTREQIYELADYVLKFGENATLNNLAEE